MKLTDMTAKKWLAMGLAAALAMFIAWSIGCNNQSGSTAVAPISDQGSAGTSLVLARVEVPGKLEDIKLPVYETLEDINDVFYVLVIATESELQKAGVTYKVLTEHVPETDYLIGECGRPGSHTEAAKIASIVYDDGYWIIVPYQMDLESDLAGLGFDIKMMAKTPMDTIPSEEDKEITKYVKYRVDEKTGHPKLDKIQKVEEMLKKVTKTDFDDFVDELSGEKAVTIDGTSKTIMTRHTESTTGLNDALAYVEKVLKDTGKFTGTIHTKEWQMEGKNPRASVKKTFKKKNLWAELPGAKGADSEVVLLIAHLDSVTEVKNEDGTWVPGGKDAAAPGADDNAGGCAALLTAAKIMSGYTFNRTVRFVFTTGEEQGVLGAWCYVVDDLTETQRKLIKAVINFDMIAYNTQVPPEYPLPFHRVKIRKQNDSGYADDKKISDLYFEVFNTYGLTGVKPEIDPCSELNSDQEPFWKKDIAAIWLIEDDKLNWNSENMHSSRDKKSLFAKGDYYTSILKAALGTAAHLAGPQ